jgi:hypothetical protein
MASSGMLRRVALCRVRRLLVTANVPSSPILVILMLEALSSSETSVVKEPHSVTSQKTPFFKNFYLSISSRAALGAIRPSILWLPGALSPGVRRPERETHQSPPTRAEGKKTWIYTPIPPDVFRASYLVNLLLKMNNAVLVKSLFACRLLQFLSNASRHVAWKHICDV